MAKKKYKEGKNCQKYTRYSVEKIKLDHQHHTNQEHRLERDTPLVTKSGAGKIWWLFWKLLFVQLSFRARNQN